MDGVTDLLRDFGKRPHLTLAEENALAVRIQAGDQDALRELIGSHILLAYKLVRGYKKSGLPEADLLQEAAFAMIQCAPKFDPAKARFAVYSCWWMRQRVQHYILLNTSMVVRGGTSGMRTKISKIRRRRVEIEEEQPGLHPHQYEDMLCDELSMTKETVQAALNLSPGTDMSLNTPVYNSAGQERGEFQDFLVDEQPNPEERACDKSEMTKGKRLLRRAMAELHPREREIFIARCLTEDPPTLLELSLKLGVTRERVRQLEVRARANVERMIRYWLTRGEDQPYPTRALKGRGNGGAIYPTRKEMAFSEGL